MRARVQNGYWVFQAPVGYRYERTSGHGKLLVRDEPNASAIQEALEGYASGRFETQVEVKRFLERQPSFPKDPAERRNPQSARGGDVAASCICRLRRSAQLGRLPAQRPA